MKPCLPPRKRHYIVNDHCAGCGRTRLELLEDNPRILAGTAPPRAALPAVPAAHAAGRLIPEGGELKLEAMSELVSKYEVARSRLVKFMQHQGLKDVPDDPLEEVAQGVLDVLYKDYGRETFWKSHEVKHGHGSSSGKTSS